nr:trithorax group protein osa-like [Onthophagus taurus]
MDPITNPPIPYLGPIGNGFSSGKLIRVQGSAAPQAERIDFNLVTNENKDDIGLHLSVRLLEGYVARNSYEGGIWGAEQDKGDLPIQPGENFEIVIFADNSEYKIAINGRHFCEFPYRIPIKNISHLSIEGQVSVSLISFEEVPQHAKVQASTQQDIPMAPQSNIPPQGPANFGPPGYEPQGPPLGQYGPPPNQYGPPPNQYGPPPNQYGPPPNQFGPGPYGAPPPPPGHDQKGESGLDSFLGSAQTVIQGAIASGMAEKLLSSLTSGGNNPQQQSQQQPQNYQQQPQQQPNIPSSHQNQTQQPTQAGPDIMGSLGTLLNTLTTPPRAPLQQNQPNQQYQQQQPLQQSSQNQPDVLGSLGSLLSTLTTSPQTQQQQQHPSPQQQYQQP